MLNGWLISLEEIGLIELSRARRETGLDWRPGSRQLAADKVMPWPHLVIFLFMAVISVALVIAISGWFAFSGEFSAGSWLLPAILASVGGWCIAHECSHLMAARLLGIRGGRIKWRKGARIAPHFRIEAVSEDAIASPRIRYLIYMAGPLCDCAIGGVIVGGAGLFLEHSLGWLDSLPLIFISLSLVAQPGNDVFMAQAAVAANTQRAGLSSFFTAFKVLAIIFATSASAFFLLLAGRAAALYFG